jgi:YidC/Oxa1 family membrane protein insertase
MQRNVLLFVVLSFLVIAGFQFLMPSKPEQVPPRASTTATTAKPAKPSPPPPSSSPASAPSSTGSSPASASSPSEEGRDITVDNAFVRATFTTRGGALKSWRLKKYHDTAGVLLELVPQTVGADVPLPFTLSVQDAALSSELQNGSFTPSADALHVEQGQQSLRFDFRSASGLEAHKTFTFSAAQPYLLTFSASVTRAGQPVNFTIHGGPSIGGGLVPHSRGYNPPSQPIYFKDGSIKRVAQDKIPAQAVQEGTFGFVGVDDHYFLDALVAPQAPLRVEYQPLAIPIEGNPAGAHFVRWWMNFPAPPTNTTFFLGPKDFDVLAAVDRNLVRAIDFGMFAWLAVPLLRALKWINGFAGNYGWSVIILTVLINLAMFPLRHKSVVSMRKMQEIQPEVKAIQDRYAKLKMSDPARSKMNVELMNLYRERGVNPASGCVPMLLTFPVLFAFYSLLAVAIELRGAPFIFWIHDLVAPDPYYVLPVLMGATMFFQQRMTPTTADPMQQKMMLVMPVVLAGMSLWWSSGLLLYWTVSNLWGIGQQMITNRLIGPMQQRTVRPPAERRMKKAGSGRTDQAKEHE